MKSPALLEWISVKVITYGYIRLNIHNNTSVVRGPRCSQVQAGPYGEGPGECRWL